MPGRKRYDEMLNVMIVAADPHRQVSLMEYIDLTSSIRLVALVNDLAIALPLLEKEIGDILIVDLHTPEITEIILFDHLPAKTAIIFTTSFPEHAKIGFDLGIADLLLKPFQLP